MRLQQIDHGLMGKQVLAKPSQPPWQHCTVFVQGTLWGINSFDQWGVELGKELANRITPELIGEPDPSQHDSSTNAAIAWYRANRG